MNLQERVPILVVSGRPEDAELVSRNLRNAGCNAHCTRVDGVGEVADALEGPLDTHLVVDFTAGSDLAGLPALVQVRDRVIPDVPILVVLAKGGEELLALDEALESYKKALKVESDMGDRMAEILCLNDIGNVYLIQGKVDDQKNTIVAAGGAVALVLLIIVFMLGKRSGRKKTTLVVIKRR